MRWFIMIWGIFLTTTAVLFVPHRTPPPLENIGLSSMIITFTSYRGHSQFRYDVYQLSLTDHQMIQITDDDAFEEGVDWSPNGGWLVYSRSPVASPYYIPEMQLFRLSRFSQHPQQLTHCNGRNAFPDISPDGRWIVYESDCEGENALVVMRSNGRDKRRITPVGFPVIGFQKWSPDGKWIVFVGKIGLDQDIFRIRADGTNLQNLTNDPENRDTFPHWDGGWIAYLSGKVPEEALVNNWNWALDLQVMRMRPDGSDQLALTPPIENCCSTPRVSPDGDWVVYVEKSYLNHHERVPIRKVRLDGTDNTLITEIGWLPQWSPDGEEIFYILPNLDLYAVDANGGVPRKLGGNSLREPIWIRYNPPPRPILGFAVLGVGMVIGGMVLRRHYSSRQRTLPVGPTVP